MTMHMQPGVPFNAARQAQYGAPADPPSPVAPAAPAVLPPIPLANPAAPVAPIPIFRWPEDQAAVRAEAEVLEIHPGDQAAEDEGAEAEVLVIHPDDEETPAAEGDPLLNEMLEGLLNDDGIQREQKGPYIFLYPLQFTKVYKTFVNCMHG